MPTGWQIFFSLSVPESIPLCQQSLHARCGFGSITSPQHAAPGAVPASPGQCGAFRTAAEGHHHCFASCRPQETAAGGKLSRKEVGKREIPRGGEKRSKRLFLRTQVMRIGSFNLNYCRVKTGKERVKPPILEVGGISETYDSGL